MEIASCLQTEDEDYRLENDSVLESETDDDSDIWEDDEEDLLAELGDIVRDAKDQVFPFFNLPAEMRNHIYDECLVDVTSDKLTMCGVQVIAQDTVATNLLLVSKQFQEEYRARLPRDRTVILTRSLEFDFSMDFANYGVPPPLLKINNINIVFPMNGNNYTTHFAVLSVGLSHLLAQLLPSQTITVHWVFTGLMGTGRLWKEFQWHEVFEKSVGVRRLYGESRGFQAFTINVYWKETKGAAESDERALMQGPKVKWHSGTDQVEQILV